MAKTSAKSKGYRKTIKKKPFLTKKEIIELIVILAVILLGVVLFNIFYDDGFVKAHDLQANDIVSFASTDLRDRYKKVAVANELEGFTKEERAEDETPVAAHTYIAEGDQNNIESISVSGSFVDAVTLVNTTMSYMSGGLSEDSTVSEVIETTIQDHPAYVFTYTYGEYDEAYGAAATDEAAVEEAAEATEEAAEATEEAQPANNKFTQAISAYIVADDTHTLCLHIYRRGGDESFYLAQEELVDFIQPYTAAFTLNPIEE